METKTVRSAIYLAGGIGLLVSVFSAVEFFNASLEGVCSINSFFSCALVNASGKTTTLGVPDYLWGIAGFVAILVVAGLAEARPKDVRRAYGLVALTSAGVALTVYFLYIELAEIHAVCVVCATAYVFGYLAWAGAIALLGKTRALARPAPPDEPSHPEPT